MTLEQLLHKLRQGEIVEFDAQSPLAMPVLAKCYGEFPNLKHWHNLHGMNAQQSMFMQVPTVKA